MKKILLVVNTDKDKDYKLTNELIIFLKTKNLDIYSDNNIPNTLNLENINDIDLTIILGGDGTILAFVDKYKNANPLIYGINLGRVGVLTEGDINTYQEDINKILNGKYYLEERNTLNAKLYDQDKLVLDDIAYNEVSIHRASLVKMILIKLLINNHHKTLFYADGVLVSTSTGSSAYNLSSGGPILLPNAANFVITPISPQLRTITSLVTSDKDIIEISLIEEKNRQEYGESPLLVLDGRKKMTFKPSMKLIIKEGNNKLRIAKINNDTSLFEATSKVALTADKVKEN